MSDTKPNDHRRTIPATAYGMDSRELDDWMRCNHPDFIGGFHVVRSENMGYSGAGLYDGYVEAETTEGSAYILGWFRGRSSMERSK